MMTIIGLVAAKVGVAILPSASAQIRHAAVAYRNLTPRLMVDTGLIWNRATLPGKPPLLAFLQTAAAVFPRV